MADYGHRESDRRLAELERRIEKEYQQAYTEIKAKADEFFEKFRDKDKKLSQKVKQGEINKSDYIEWRRKAIIRGNALKDLEKTLAQDLVNADRIAGQMISGHKVDVYALNRNYGEYEIENALNIDLGFSIYDHKSVEKLIKDQPALLPTQLDEARDLKWNRQKVNSAITQGILQGESIPNIGKRLRKVVGMDKTASIRNARTATTGAENAGRVDSYEEAESKGVELEKKWVATLDQRTRSEHRQLDGQTCPIHDKFKVDGEEIGYPGDPTAEGSLVYNCRCTLVADIKGIKYKDVRWDRLPEGMTYEEWKGVKKEESVYIHKTFGKGKIIDSDDTFTTIDFGDKGVKKLMTSMLDNFRVEESIKVDDKIVKKIKTESQIKGDGFVRFGKVPEGERSVNYTKLTLDQQRDLEEATDNGENPIKAMEWYKANFKNWKNVNIDDVTENGVSVFKAKDGIPQIDNIDQAISLAVRLDKDAYEVKGKVIGTGQDKEPILKNTTSQKITIDKEKLTKKLLNTMKENFNDVSGKIDLSESNNILMFVDQDTKERYYVYKGLTFKKPKNKNWKR